MKFPASLGACIDLAYRTREKRLLYEKEVEKEVERLKTEEKQIADYIISNFEKDDIESARGKVATATKAQIVHAQVEDWDKLWTWIAKTESWDMLMKKVNDKAYRARLDAEVKVPGVSKFTEVKLHLNKR